MTNLDLNSLAKYGPFQKFSFDGVMGYYIDETHNLKIYKWAYSFVVKKINNTQTKQKQANEQTQKRTEWETK